MKTHRRVWIEHYGEIPVDENGQSYEIHHINKNHQDNNIENLMCLSIRDHFKIHYDQGDMWACQKILSRMAGSKDELFEKYSDFSLKGPNHPMYGRAHTDEAKKKIGLSSSQRNSGSGNPMYGKTHSQKSKDKMSSSKLGISTGPKDESHRLKISESNNNYWANNKSKRVRKVSIEGIIYQSAVEASKFVGIDPVNVRRRCRIEKYKDWKYL
jgi:group I intron endonuclease